ncbi:MAG: hypothetical protein KDB37_22045, partial [Ilumatobacter sp.]|nr:hypothetical protein [Ilumatobacter sp.]
MVETVVVDGPEVDVVSSVSVPAVSVTVPSVAGGQAARTSVAAARMAGGRKVLVMGRFSSRGKAS